MQSVGDVGPSDEFMHAPTSDTSFSESMMFNFFDAPNGVDGFVRIGNRVNEQHAEVTLCVFLPGGEVLFEWTRPPIEANDRFNAGGLTFDVLDPTRQLRVRYRGEAFRIRNPLQLREPKDAFKNNPRVTAALDLDIRGIGPIIGSATGDRGATIFLAGVGHYQQALQASGALTVEGSAYPITAFGARDHSWGRRIWSSLLRDRSFWMTFGPDLSFICCKTWLHGAKHPDVMGCVIEESTVTPLRGASIETHYVRGTYDHDRCRLRIEDVAGRRFDLEGRVRSFVPLRHRSPGRETVFLGQAMTEFQLDHRISVGMSEYFDAESACPGLVAMSERDACTVD